MDEALTIEYASSRRDVWQAYWYAWRHGSVLKKSQATVAVMVLVAVLLVRSGAGRLGLHDLLMALLYAVLSVVWMPLWPLLRFKKATRMLRVDAQGFITNIGHLSAVKAWPDVERVVKVPSGNVLIIGRNANMMIIPPRAFAVAAEADQFYARVQAWHAETLTQAAKDSHTRR